MFNRTTKLAWRQRIVRNIRLQLKGNIMKNNADIKKGTSLLRMRLNRFLKRRTPEHMLPETIAWHYSVLFMGFAPVKFAACKYLILTCALSVFISIVLKKDFPLPILYSIKKFRHWKTGWIFEKPIRMPTVNGCFYRVKAIRFPASSFTR